MVRAVWMRGWRHSAGVLAVALCSCAFAGAPITCTGDGTAGCQAYQRSGVERVPDTVRRMQTWRCHILPTQRASEQRQALPQRNCGSQRSTTFPQTEQRDTSVPAPRTALPATCTWPALLTALSKSNMTSCNISDDADTPNDTAFAESDRQWCDTETPRYSWQTQGHALLQTLKPAHAQPQPRHAPTHPASTTQI